MTRSDQNGKRGNRVWGYGDSEMVQLPELKLTDQECLNKLKEEYKLEAEKMITYPRPDGKGIRVLKVEAMDLTGIAFVDMETGEKVDPATLQTMLILLRNGIWKVSG